MEKVSNREVRSLVQARQQFENKEGSLIGRECADGLYAVFSYNWPLFIFYKGHWYGNNGKSTRTTSKHFGYAHPWKKLALREDSQMRDLMNVAHARKMDKFKAAYNYPAAKVEKRG